MAGGIGVEPMWPCLGAHGLASRCITALPTSRRLTREIDLSAGGDSRARTDARLLAGQVLSQTELYPHVGAAGPESNRQPRSYGLRALPFELQRQSRFVFDPYLR